MKVSVVIPAYNEEKYLPKTLQSIAELDVKPDEVLVIDGGSTDKTCEVAQQNGARCVVIEHRGIGFARQKGVEHATGDIIAFTDADTSVPRDWLTKILKTLKKPGVACVYSGYSVPDGWIPYRLFINYFTPIMFIIQNILNLAMAPGQNTAFWKSKALDVGGYPMDFKVLEDYEMARRLKKTGKVVYLWNNYVTSSGRRGNEGYPLLWRIIKVFFIYITTRRANIIGFPDMR